MFYEMSTHIHYGSKKGIYVKESEQMEYVKKDIWRILLISNPTLEIQKYVYMNNHDIIKKMDSERMHPEIELLFL